MARAARKFTGLKKPTETPNGAAFLKIIEYECDTCRTIHSPGGPYTQTAPMTKPCCAYRKGEPCTGTMTRVGWGSGKKPPPPAPKGTRPGVRVVKRPTSVD